MAVSVLIFAFGTPWADSKRIKVEKATPENFAKSAPVHFKKALAARI